VRSIGDAFFHKRPDPLTRIQLRRVGRDAQQGDAFRDIQGHGAMRGRTVPDQKNALADARMLFGERGQKSSHALCIQPWQDEPEDSPRPRMCRRVEPEPFVALINLTDRTPPCGCPDAAQDGLETEARFVLAPDFDGLRGVRLLQGLSLKPYLFLNSACPSTEARRLF